MKKTVAKTKKNDPNVSNVPWTLKDFIGRSITEIEVSPNLDSVELSFKGNLKIRVQAKLVSGRSFVSAEVLEKTMVPLWKGDVVFDGPQEFESKMNVAVPESVPAKAKKQLESQATPL